MKSNEKMKVIIKQLKDGVNSVYSSENYVQLLNLISHMHSYSVNNCILILSQNPNATCVASLATWKKMGYKIRRGSKGIKILVPIPYKFKKEQKNIDENRNETTETIELICNSLIHFVFPIK